MEVVTGTMNTLLPKLDSLLTGEYRLQRGLTDDIRFLKAELESMQAALTMVSAEAQMNWARIVRDLSYDVEDIIDTFMVRIEAHPSARLRGARGFLVRSMGLFTRLRIQHRIASDITDIKTLVREVAERRDRYPVDDVIYRPMAQAIDPRLHGIYEESTKLVAISGPTEELSRLLMEQEGTSKLQLKVISIVGVGGLGKTTLANVVYQQLRHQFDCDAFVSVSLKPDLKRILSSILRQVCEEHYNIDEILELINKIRQVLGDKRYFIIIDDIWDESAWKIIKCALVENNFGSRIITTTRSVDVAESCCLGIDGTVYKLKPLFHDDSKQLFYKRVFGSEGGCHPELKEISEAILRKCSGIPLAIITIAGLLANKQVSLSEWIRVHESIGSGLEKSSNMDDLRQILSISYDGLPSVLKPCFLYLCVFPEDYSIPVDQLVRRWIAEGFVHGEHDSDDTVSLFGLGMSYLFELINRNLIQPEYITAWGEIEVCRVHDMVLDLITFLSNKENFVLLGRKRKENSVPTSDGDQYIPKKIRRLSFQINEEGHDAEHEEFPHVRSLIIFPGATSMMPPLSNFPVLRVLDLEHCRDLKNHQIITGLGKLFHLRYMGLRDTNITKLPRQLGNLHCLHTLDLSNTAVTELPSTIVFLNQLVHLYIEDSVKLPIGIGKLKSLQLLVSIGVSHSPNVARELGNLTELRVLHISLISGTDEWHKSYEKPLIDSLYNLKKIQELHIRSPGAPTEFLADLRWCPQQLRDFYGVEMSRLPTWISPSLLNLYKISMSMLKILRQEDLKNLGALPFLSYLYLTIEKIESTEERLVVGTDPTQFQCLQHLTFKSDAMGLMFSQGAMQKLESLYITLNARETKDIYGDFNFGLENLCSVTQVTVKIRCTGSRFREVDSADTAIRAAIIRNPNNPTFDVSICFEHRMVIDQAQRPVDDETIIEGQEIMLERVGPWGGGGDRNHDIMVAPRHLENVKVSSGAVVDGIRFSYLDKYGKQHTTPLWGGDGGHGRTIQFGPSELLKEVSGTFGPYHGFPNVITSLKLVTNVRSYGLFGYPKGTAFCTRVKQNSSIVGFFGSSTSYLDAIGVYIYP